MKDANQETARPNFLPMSISVSARIGLLATVFGCLLVFATPLPGADETDLSQKLLGVTDEFRDQLATATRQGVLEIAAVNLPVDPPGDCNHYGWPVATMVSDTF